MKKVNSDIPTEEMMALTQLIELQKEGKITNNTCDRGDGIIILNFDEYL